MAAAPEYDEFGQIKQVDPQQFQQAATQQGIAGPTAPAAAPAGSFDAEQFRKGWAYGGAGFGTQTNVGELEKYIASNPSFASGVTLKGEKVYDPQGNFMFDAIGNFKSGDPSKMTRIALQGNSSYQKGSSSPKPAKASPKTAAASRAASPVAGSYNTGNMGPQSSELFNLLMARAKGSETVDPNDPIIKAQTDAFRSEGVNARRDFLAQQAEAAGPYGNLRSEQRRSAEQLGKSVGGFQGQAMQNELTARRAKIQHALDAGAAFLTDQQRMALQNELTRLQLAQQESQFGRNLKQQGSQFDRNLAMQKDQFGRSIGQRAYEYDTSRWDNIFL